MFSYWEQQSFSHYDHIIVGSGIVGLSTAIELKERYPASRVLVLERGLLPTGASTRNAGFACMGGIAELLDDLRYTSEDEMVALFQARKKGLERLRNKLSDSTIGYRANGSHELVNSDELPMLDQLDRLNAMLMPVTGKPAFRLANERIKEFGLSETYTKALVESTCEGELNTGMLLRALTDMALTHGVEVKTGADVRSFEEAPNKVTVVVKDPFRNEEWPLSCDTITMCTNAFTKQLLPDVDVVPGRGQVLITQPVPGLRLKGIYHLDKGYYYFREIDGRVLFGGGRNMDLEGERTTDIALNDTIQADLEEKLRTIILPDTPFQIAQRWAGIMAFGATKYPVVKAFSDRVFGAFRMGGMGVALGSETAYRVCELIAQR